MESQAKPETEFSFNPERICIFYWLALRIKKISTDLNYETDGVLDLNRLMAVTPNDSA